MRKLFAMVLACVTALPGAAGAAALGELSMNSYLNQKLDGRIELQALRPGDLEGMRVGLADEEAFELAGISRLPGLLDLRFELVETGAQSAYIRVSSKQRVREPSLEFIVEIQWANGRANRQYSVVMVAK